MNPSGVQLASPILPPGLTTRTIPRARVEIDGLAQGLTDRLQRGSDHGKVSRGPGGLLARLHSGEVDYQGLLALARGTIENLAHVVLLFGNEVDGAGGVLPSSSL